jgi:hypothetical protein
MSEMWRVQDDEPGEPGTAADMARAAPANSGLVVEDSVDRANPAAIAVLLYHPQFPYLKRPSSTRTFHIHVGSTQFQHAIALSLEQIRSITMQAFLRVMLQLSKLKCVFLDAGVAR